MAVRKYWKRLGCRGGCGLVDDPIGPRTRQSQYSGPGPTLHSHTPPQGSHYPVPGSVSRGNPVYFDSTSGVPTPGPNSSVIYKDSSDVVPPRSAPGHNSSAVYKGSSGVVSRRPVGHNSSATYQGSSDVASSRPIPDHNPSAVYQGFSDVVSSRPTLDHNPSGVYQGSSDVAPPRSAPGHNSSAVYKGSSGVVSRRPVGHNSSATYQGSSDAASSRQIPDHNSSVVYQDSASDMVSSRPTPGPNSGAMYQGSASDMVSSRPTLGPSSGAIYKGSTSDTESSRSTPSPNPSTVYQRSTSDVTVQTPDPNHSPVLRDSSPSPVSESSSPRSLGFSLRSQNSSSPISRVSTWSPLSRSSTPALKQLVGVGVFAEGHNPVVDLVAVHGLDGHREGTWTAEGEGLWLRDWLPKVVAHARILTYGYDGRTRGSTPLSRQTLHDHAVGLVTDLSLYRKKTNTIERPIIFIAHSIGGIIVKDALIHSNSANIHNVHHHHAIKTSTTGILFFGTPHQGTSGLSWGKIFISAASIFTNTNNAIHRSLKGGSKSLQKQIGQYTHISKHFDTKFFYETYKSRDINGFVVPRDSAVVPGATDAEVFGINSDHENLVKYKSDKDENYLKVSLCILLMSNEAPARASKNWKDWRRVEAARANGVHITFEIPFGLERVRNKQFTGRRSLISKINEETRHNKSVPVVLYGIGGIGKTQVALEYIYTYKSHYDSIFWIDATTKQTTILGFRKAAQRLIKQYAKNSHEERPNYHLIAKELDMADAVDDQGRVSPKEEYHDCIVQGVKLWLAREKNQNWLIVFDRVDDLDFGIAQFLPSVSHGTIIMTSRRPECGNFGMPLQVTEMDNSEAVELLLKSAQLDLDPKVRDPMAEEVIKKLGGLPLAIIQAGAYIGSRKMQLKRYRDIFDKHYAKVLSEKPSHFDFSDGAHTIFTTWDISFQAVKKGDTNAAELLSLCSFLSNEDIQEDMLRRGKKLEDDDITLHDSLKLLFSYSLIQRKGREESFYINPMVHLWAHERLTGLERVEKAAEAAVLVGNAISCKYEKTPKYWEHANRIIPHVEVVGTNVGRYLSAEMADIPLTDGFSWLARIHNDLGRWKDAEKLQLLVVDANKRVRSTEHPDTVTAIANLGFIYYRQEKFKEAEELQLKVVKARKDLKGKEYTLSLKAMEALATTYRGQERWKDAEKLQQQVVDGRQKVLGEENLKTLVAMANLAIIYASQDRFKEAEVLERKVYEVRLKKLGAEHPDTKLAKGELDGTYMLLVTA